MPSILVPPSCPATPRCRCSVHLQPHLLFWPPGLVFSASPAHSTFCVPGFLPGAYTGPYRTSPTSTTPVLTPLLSALHLCLPLGQLHPDTAHPLKLAVPAADKHLLFQPLALQTLSPYVILLPFAWLQTSESLSLPSPPHQSSLSQQSSFSL